MRPNVSCCKTLEELLVGGGESVIRLVGGRPEGVTAHCGQIPDDERGVVGGLVFESDVRVLAVSKDEGTKG